ncbi:MAG: OmpA family protein [Runella sp.]
MRVLGFIILIFWFNKVWSQRIGVYHFNHTLEEESGALPKLRVLGKEGTFKQETLPELGPTKRIVYAFDKNCGLQFDNRAAGNFLGQSYTIEIYFRFTALDSWKRVIDFKNRKSDNGCYIYDGKLNFYSFALGTKAPVRPNEYTHLVVVRDNTSQQLRMYIDGESKIEFTDRTQEGVIDQDGVLNFFFDDLIVKDEASEGAVALLKIYDRVLEPASIRANFQQLANVVNTPTNPKITTPSANTTITPPNNNSTQTPISEKNYTNIDPTTVGIGKAIVLKHLIFEQSKAELLPASEAELLHLLELMQKNPTMEVELQGHTDNIGDFDLNLILSKQRVEAVKTYLVSKGIAPHRIVGRGFGATRPIASNNREETRQLNRRVELIIIRK